MMSTLSPVARTLACENRSSLAPARSALSRLLKRLLDLTGSAVLLLILSPIMLVLAALIALADGLPVIHRRRVVGPDGQFDAFKFRSMRKDADEILERDPAMRAAFEQDFKLKADPRVTRLGAVMRKYSLDEIPQLFNVLLGQMSLVGPRMITAAELPKYGEFQPLFLAVKPGMTGYWQIEGRQSVGYTERVKMDVQYIQGWSLGWDLKILLLTPWRVMAGRGAY